MSLAKLCFGEVRHTRIKPAKNSFSYSVFSLRIPMRARREAKDGISQWGLGDNSASLLSFYDKDHGKGGEDSLSWANEIIESFGIKDAKGEIWLHTFPRVLGYVFNPVSFWFFENENGDLRAVLAEVNNTFGERHCYFLNNEDGSHLNWGQTLRSTKIFHVSPFCDTEGTYLFRFFSHKSTPSQHVARIEYHLDGPVLITSINGIEKNITLGTIVWSAIRYPAMSFGVIFRIHWQAIKLWFKGVPFHAKPIPPASEVSK